MKKFSFLIFVFFLSFSLVFPQLSQTGMIRGTVADVEGQPIPGVTVTIKSPSLIISKIDTLSNENGAYRFPSLSPGTYEIVFKLEGFKSLFRKGIIVHVGETITVDIGLELGKIEEEIIVTGKAPTIDRQKTTKTATLDSNFISGIPATRTLGTYFNMTPGTTGNTSHGGSVRDNTYNVDGVNTTDGVVGTEALFFSMDTVEEISVQSGGLSAEYGQVRGAVVNVISKSGGNTFHGAIDVFYRHESLKSDNTKGTPLEGESSGAKFEMEPGFSLGGPIVKNKLWFFVNLSFNKRETYVSGYPYNKDEDVPTDDYRPYPYLKLSYQPNKDNKVIFSYRYSDIQRHHRGASRYQLEATTWEQKTATHVFNLHYTKFIGSNFYMNIKAFMYLSQFNLLAKNDEANWYESTNYLNTGSHGYDDINPRDRYSIQADGTFFIDNFMGSHQVKIGAEYMQSNSGRELRFKQDSAVSDMCFITTYNGSLWYGTWYAPYNTKEITKNIFAYVQDTWNIGSKLTANIGIRFQYMRGIIPKQNEDEGDQTLFGYAYNRSVPEALTPLKWTTLAPRLGLIYDLFEDGKTLLKASFSRYYMANLSQWFSGANPNGWVYYGGVLNSDGSVAYPYSIGISGPEYATKFGYEDHDAKAPYTDEFVIGFEKEIFEDWSVGIRYIRKWDRNLLEDANSEALDMDKLMNEGILEWTNFAPVTVTDTFDNSTVTFWDKLSSIPFKGYTINPPDAKRDYDSIEITLNKRYSHGWQMKASYVYQNSRGLIGTDFGDSWGGTGYYDSPNSHINAIGRFPLERRHQFKFQSTVKGPFGLNLGTYFRYLSGGRYTRTINNNDLGLSLFQGSTTIYGEERGSRAYPAVAILDLKLEKRFNIGNFTLVLFGDCFNVLNSGKATGVHTSSSNPTYTFEEMTAIQSPRIFRIGSKIEW